MPISKPATALVVVGTIAALAVMNSNSGPAGSQLFGHPDHDDIDSTFAAFVAQHNRQFMTIGEFQARRKNFADNLAVIRKNTPDSGVELDLN
jgi:hypothetical protein